MEKKGKPIYLVMMESNVDGEILFDAIPCSTLKAARKVLKIEKNFILKEASHYKKYTEEELKEEFEVEEGKNRFFINDPNDNYYEDYYIVRRIIYE